MARRIVAKKTAPKKEIAQQKRGRGRPKKNLSEAAPAKAKPEKAKKIDKLPKKVTSDAPIESGYLFADEKDLLSFAKDSANHTRKILNMTHSVDDIADFSKLKFDWNERPVDKSHVLTLSQSIKKRGLLEPIFIALDISGTNPVMQVVRGRHRSEAIKILRTESKYSPIPEKRLKLPAKVVFYDGREDYNADKKQRWADIASNIQELTKKDHIIARADTFAQIQTELVSSSKKDAGKPQRGSGPVSSVAISLGLAKSTVRSALNVRNLPDGLREAIRKSLERAIDLRANAKTDRERKKIKDIPEKFLYKIAGNYNRVRQDFEKEMKEVAMEELGISYEIKKFKGVAGREMQKNLIPEAQRGKVKAKVAQLVKENWKELDKKLHEKERELIALVEEEAAIKAGIKKKKKSDKAPAKKTKLDISDLKSVMADLTEKEAEKLLKGLRKKGLDI